MSFVREPRWPQHRGTPMKIVRVHSLRNAASGSPENPGGSPLPAMRSSAVRVPPPLGAVALILAVLVVSAAPCRAQFFNAVYSADALDVIAVGDSGAIYRSLSGGVAWMRESLGDKPLRDVWKRGTTIVVVGDSGKVWRSVDRGHTWALSVMAGTPSLRRLEAPGGDHLIAVGGGGTVLLSSDEGASWSAQASGTGEQLNGVRFEDAQNGWIAGSNGFLARTADGGGSWQPVALGTANHLN